MSAGDELEAALQQRWSFDELEVYADALISQNDVRGELIALDLMPRPEQPSWVDKRRAALAKWLGPSLATRAGHLVQHGFVHELRDGMAPAALLDSEAGTYVRGYTTWGRTRVQASLERLAARPRPWLSRLAIAHHGDDPLPPSLVRALIAATPRLEEICIAGRPPFEAFPHPAVRHARLDTRCYAIQIDAPKTRIDVPDGCPGPRLAPDDLELLLELVELAPDVNQLYTHGEHFSEPLPALIARLAAAQLVELAGPVVRAASPGMVLAPAEGAIELPAVTGDCGWIDHDRARIEVRDPRRHVALIRSCLDLLPVSPRLRDTLADYCRRWDVVRTAPVPVDADRGAQVRAALVALLELRGLWPLAIGSRGDWVLLEQLGESLPGDGGFEIRLDYDWF